jgi:phosphoribosyl 1,2-cyclic phosphate phosphodiesterase
LRLTFLGTGTSFGIPVIGCDCPVCRSEDVRDRRTRHAALIEQDGRTLLVDTPPELRLQLVAAGVRQVDAVWYTHSHADHVHGVDDLRAFTARSGKGIRVLASPVTARTLLGRFRYVFDETMVPHPGTSRPEAFIETVDAYRPVEVAGMSVLPLPVPHGSEEVTAFRIGDLGYVTDAKSLPPETESALRGVRTLVLNALWFGHPHPTHFSVEEAVDAARAVGAERTYLTHLSHRVSQAELDRRLPEGVFAAYDGLVIDI